MMAMMMPVMPAPTASDPLWRWAAQGQECDDGDVRDDNGCTTRCALFAVVMDSPAGSGPEDEGYEECDDGDGVNQACAQYLCPGSMWRRHSLHP